MYQGGTVATRSRAAGPAPRNGHSGRFGASICRRQPRPATDQQGKSSISGVFCRALSRIGTADA